MSRAELRELTGWDHAPAIRGYTFMAPHVGAVCVGIRPSGSHPSAAADQKQGGKSVRSGQSSGKSGKSGKSPSHAIWQVPLGRSDSLLYRGMLRAAVQLLAYVAPRVLVKVPEDALVWYLDAPLSGAEREILRWSKWTPEPVRGWAKGMRS